MYNSWQDEHELVSVVVSRKKKTNATRSSWVFLVCSGVSDAVVSAECSS
jgi:hypothetical protein